MNFFKSKYEIRTDLEKHEGELKLFTEKLDIIKAMCKKEKNQPLFLDIIWDEIIKIYTDHFSSVQEIQACDADALEKELILTLYGSAIHHTTKSLSMKKWLKSVYDRNKDCPEIHAFSKDKWIPWLVKEIVPFETTYVDGPCEERHEYTVNIKTKQGEIKIKRELHLAPITQMSPKSDLNNMFRDYILRTVKSYTKSVYMGEDVNRYNIYHPCPQLIYDILTNWKVCPMNSKYYYGMKLETLNNFQENILQYRKNKSILENISYANSCLEFYMMEELFDFKFAESLIKIINERIVIHSNRDEEYTYNAMVLRYAKRIQDGTSQFLRNRIIRSYEKSDNWLPDINENNILFGFTVPLLEIIYSYFIGYILDDNFQTDSFAESGEFNQENEESINRNDLFYSKLLKVCEGYIDLHKSEYDLFFDYYHQPVINNYVLNSKCIALDINITKSLYVIDDCLPSFKGFKTINDCLDNLKTIPIQLQETNNIYNPQYYLRFPFNNIYSEYCYKTEIAKQKTEYFPRINRKVPNFLHVRWGDFWYSVPEEYKNKFVELRFIDNTIEIYNKEGKRIADHIIRYNGERLVTDSEHITKDCNYRAKFQNYLILKHASSIGNSTLRIIKIHLNSKETTEKQKLIICKRIFSLAEKIKDKEKFESACKKALELKRYLVNDIQKLLSDDSL